MDEDRRRESRRALTGLGDPAKVERDSTRHGEGLNAFLLSLVGEVVFIEGVRINYRGRLSDVFVGGDGRVQGYLLAAGCERISYFTKERAHTLKHEHPKYIAYEMVHDIGLHGFAGGKWANL